MSYWNYRIVRKETSPQEYGYIVLEVYYNDDDQITGWIEAEAYPYGMDKGELKEDLFHMCRAFDKPVLQMIGKGEEQELVEL